MQWYLKALRQYADFKGRAQRKEYWMFTLFNLIIMVVLQLVGGGGEGGLGDVLSGIYSLGVLLPSVGVTVRRLHDIGKSGWWALLMIIPIIGALVLIYFAVQDSQEGSNEYGPNPKEAGLPV
jgi:uncharacterized membrane protein YhaH (DUF805 family)